MNSESLRYSFGPVPSRRLGQSLGVNTIPPKVCSYACVYCQVGRTTRIQTERRPFVEPEVIFQDVQARIAMAQQAAERIDYLTFVPDGEPTLDIHLGREILLLKTLGLPVGVITNSSLISREDVRTELAYADWVSLKIDTVHELRWRRLNRPAKGLQLDSILEGICAFASTFTGMLVTETMLVRDMNTDDEALGGVADLLRALQPDVAYISIPTRPPADPVARPPDEAALTRAYQLFSQATARVEYLIGYEGDAFAATDNAEADLLNITAVHPMRKEAVAALLSRSGSSWEVVDRLVARGDLLLTAYAGHAYVVRAFSRRHG